MFVFVCLYITVLWNQAVHTDGEVTANRPDIIIKNKKEKTCTLIDVAIPADGNVVQKEGALTYPAPLGSPRPVTGYLYFIYIYI